jgi:protein arginine N-methyltransferase 1
MYSISSFGLMINDTGRMEAYVQALKQAIKPDSIVLDIGTGTGIFSLLACQFGAKKVYAVEPSNAIHLAKEIAKINGYSEKIDFIQNISTEINLPEKVDIIISDLRGILPLFNNHIPSIIDARKRFLSPNGVLIPQEDLIYGGIVSVPEIEEEYSSPWLENVYNLDMKPALKYMKNTWTKARIRKEELISEPQLLGKLNYYKIEDVNWETEINFRILEDKIGHGICLWFDAILGKNIGFSNSPLSESLEDKNRQQLIYGQSFFPWQKPLELVKSDQVKIKIKADLVGYEYIWRWETKITGKNQEIKGNFKQSSFFAQPLSIAQLNKKSANYEPSLNEEGKATKLVLELIDKGEKLGTIAKVLKHEFPSHFITDEKALAYIGNLSQTYSN